MDATTVTPILEESANQLQCPPKEFIGRFAAINVVLSERWNPKEFELKSRVLQGALKDLPSRFPIPVACRNGEFGCRYTIFDKQVMAKHMKVCRYRNAEAAKKYIDENPLTSDDCNK